MWWWEVWDTAYDQISLLLWRHCGIPPPPPPLIWEAAASFRWWCWCVFNVNAFPLLQKMFPGYCDTLTVSLAWHLAWKEKWSFLLQRTEETPQPGSSQRRAATHCQRKAEVRSSELTSGFPIFLPNNNATLPQYVSASLRCKNTVPTIKC